MPRELLIDDDAELYDINGDVADPNRLLDPDDYTEAQLFGA